MFSLLQRIVSLSQTSPGRSALFTRDRPEMKGRDGVKWRDTEGGRAIVDGSSRPPALRYDPARLLSDTMLDAQ